MPHEFVIKSQRRIYQAVAGQHQRVFAGCPADQPLLAHGFSLMQKPKRTCRSDFRNVVPIRQFKRESLATNQRMGEIDLVRDGIGLRWVNTDELIAFAKFQWTKNPNISTRAALL